MNYLIVVVGPTAIGKTAHSIALAKALGCEIVSCDSRQFYQEMCIGTAVPEAEELAAAPHHFIQHKSIQDTYNVGLYEQEALTKLDELFTHTNRAILVGGSGLYVHAVMQGLDQFPAVEPKIRQEIESLYQRNGLSYLQTEFKRVDPSYFADLLENNPQTLQNPQRLMRFIEVSLGSEYPYSHYLQRKEVQRNFTPIVLGLQAERSVLYERINLRVDLMIEKGLVDEVKGLRQEKYNNALQTVGYAELFDYLDGRCELPEAIERIKQNSRRYAKRQLTWFTHKLHAQWFDYQTPTAQLVDYIEQIMQTN